MNLSKRIPVISVFLALLVLLTVSAVNAQRKSDFQILTDAELTKVVPTSFYFAGQSAPTQVRNASAAKVGKDRFVIAALVDTSGYSTEISGKYEGFLITDSAVSIGGKLLGTGAYGFGFSGNGRINIFDLSSKQILSVATVADTEMKRPRPLMMAVDAKGVRLYKGKSYVVISAK